MKAYLLLVFGFCLVLFSCTKDPNEEIVEKDQDSEYVVLSNLGSSAYFGAYEQMPFGEVDNVGQHSLQRSTLEYFRPYGDQWLFTRSNLDGKGGIARYSVNGEGRLAESGFVAFLTAGNNSGQSAIYNDTQGFYVDEGRGRTKIQKFNPTSMQRTGELDLNLPEVIAGWSGNVWVGTQLLMTHGDKLFASVTYALAGEEGWNFNNKGFTLAVIDIASGKFEKLISSEKARNTGYASTEFPYFVHDDLGNAYILTMGWDWIKFSSTSEIHPDPKPATILRIGAGSTDFDANWSLTLSDLGISRTAKNIGPWFMSMAFHQGMLYVDVNPTMDGYSWGDLANDPWYIYAVDPNTKAYKRVKRADGSDFSTTYPNNGSNLFRVGEDLYARSPATNNVSQSAFYKITGDQANLAFSLKDKAIPRGIAKLKKAVN